MTARETLAALRSRGHYRINFRPRAYRTNALTLSQCKERVRNNRVSLRGWDFPHFPDEDGLATFNDHYEGWIDWSGYKEVWRLYTSEQFIMLRALREDWAQESLFQDPNLKPGEVLNVVGSVVYEVAEICEFLARLRNSGMYREGVQLRISLRNMQGRVLRIEDRSRMPLINLYRSNVSEIDCELALAPDEVNVGDPTVAIVVIKHIFDRFGWHNPSKDLVENLASDYLLKRDRR